MREASFSKILGSHSRSGISRADNRSKRNIGKFIPFTYVNVEDVEHQFFSQHVNCHEGRASLHSRPCENKNSRTTVLPSIFLGYVLRPHTVPLACYILSDRGIHRQVFSMTQNSEHVIHGGVDCDTPFNTISPDFQSHLALDGVALKLDGRDRTFLVRNAECHLMS